MGGPPSNAHRNDWATMFVLQRTTRTAPSASLEHTSDNAAVQKKLDVNRYISTEVFCANVRGTVNVVVLVPAMPLVAVAEMVTVWSPA